MIIPVLAVLAVAGAAIARRRHRRAATRREADAALCALASQLARSMRTGATLRLALEEAAAVPGSPLATELSPVVQTVRRGVAVDAALDAWQQRSPLHGVDLLVAACRFGQVSGGDLAGALEGVAATLTDAQDAADEARSLTTQATTSMWLLVALPIVGVLGFTVVDPAVASTLLTDPVGRICLVAGLALNGLGAWTGHVLVRRSLT